jgi:hypothetical protein
MPRAAREIGAAVATVPLAAMGARVEREWKQLETAGRGVHEGGA